MSSPLPCVTCVRAQALARFTLPLCCHSCLLGGSTGGWYVWSPEGTESGLQWHVNPGSLRSPSGGEASRGETTSGGREAGGEVTGAGRGESSVQIHKHQCFWCLSHPWICHGCLEMLWCVRRCGGIRPVGRSLWGGCTCRALSLSEALAKVKAATARSARVRVLSSCP